MLSVANAAERFVLQACTVKPALPPARLSYKSADTDQATRAMHEIIWYVHG